ncbi:MAG: nitroreductase family protein [Chloroflexi bacterium]|nr:nitroreductase family protein [Chloroflexota bacterium]
MALTRRSIRVFQPRPIPDDLLRDLLTIAMWAPSAHNRQPWRFAVVTADDAKHHLASAMGDQLRADLQADGVSVAVIEKDVGRSYTRITGAAALVCLCMSMVDMDHYPDEHRAAAERVMAIQSTAMAGQNLLLAAHAAGLGACWMCAPLFCADVVRQVLRLPEDWEPQALIPLGYPAQQRERTREALETRLLWR